MNIKHFSLDRQYANLKDELLEATHCALKDGVLVGGEYTRAFEKWLAERTGAKYAITVHSGTQALEIIARFKIAQLRSYSTETIVPTMHLPNITYPATMNAFITAGWNIQIDETDSNGLLISSRSDSRRAALSVQRDGHYECVVGLYGARPDRHIRWDTGTIVDGAQHWLVANGQLGAGMAVSFDPTKNLPSSGNGGAIVTKDRYLYEYAALYKDNGKNEFASVGTNSKMSEQDCAQLLVRTKYIDAWQARREHIKNYWCEAFKDLPIRCLSAGIEHHANQKFVMYTPERDDLHKHMLDRGIETKIHYPYTLSELPIANSYIKPDFFSTSWMLTRGVISLPMYPELTDDEVEYITDSVKAFTK
jgi:dTDP-4-amino-4,6-dideoxygalactose transaminase